MRYFVQLSYQGTNYHGWQFQPNAISVQEILERTFSTLLQEKTAITGAGRTDAGVHAKNFIAHFDMDNPIYENDIQLFIFKLNYMLPADVIIHKIFEVPSDFHARFDAKSRTYQYIITRTKNPFNIHGAWLRWDELDINLMNEACEILMQYTDFTSFAKLHTDNKTNDCNLMLAHWKEDNEMYIFEIKANRFLRNMVRSIVGTMMDVGKQKISLEQFRAIIESKNRSSAGISAPAQGLYLMNIEYNL